MNVVAVVLAALAVQYGPDQLHYDVDVTHTRHRLQGTETISFHNPFDAPLDHVWIRKWDQAYGPCAKCTKQRITLDPPVPPDGTGSAEVPVSVEVPSAYDRFGSLGRIDVFGNALPILAVSENGAEPRLPPYTFLGESFFSLTASWTVRLTLQPGERVASTGQETGRDGDTVTLEAPAERDFMIVAGPMEMVQETRDGVRVRWFSRGRPARRGLRRAAGSLAALQRTLGPYGAPEFDVLETPVLSKSNGIAMEYPQIILTPPAKPALTHEVAHQWFYRLVGNDEWSDPWVDETMTSFAAIRLGRRLNGLNYLDGCDRRTAPPDPPVPVDSGMARLIREFEDDRGVIAQTLYRAGPCALFNLQRRIGVKRTDAFLRGLVRRYRGGILTSEQLRDEIAALAFGARALREMKIS
jgi:hypothetical protein